MASRLRRRAARVVFLVTLAIASTSGGPSARAEPTAADRETARSLMDQGFDRRAKGDPKGALKAFEAADALMHVPTTGVEVARSQAALGLLVEARGTALDVSRSTPSPGDPSVFAEARRQATLLAAELERRIPSLALRFTNAGSAAPSVAIDGAPIPPAAVVAPRRLNPGTHEVVATVDTRQKKVDVELAEGETRTLDVAFEPAPPAEVEPPAPAREAPPPPPPPVAERPRPNALAWIGFGVAGAGLAVGSVTGVLAFTNKTAAEDYCLDNVCSPAAHDDITTSKTMGTVSTIAFAVAVVGAAVGVYGLVTAPRKPGANVSGSGWLGVSPAGIAGRF
jgi:hypothetical protein